MSCLRRALPGPILFLWVMAILPFPQYSVLRYLEDMTLDYEQLSGRLPNEVSVDGSLLFGRTALHGRAA